MRRGRSSGNPTKAQAARIEAVKEGSCMACLVRVEQGAFPAWRAAGPCDYHHLLSGGRRRGHDFGIALCGWHHRSLLDWGMTHDDMRECYGPSLMDGSKLFHAAFGDDDSLLARQNELIRWSEVA